MTATTSVRAAVVGNDSEFRMTDVQLDAIQDHEVLVEIQAVGLCHTDVTVASGGLPFPLPGVLGHEGTGMVREIGSAVQDLEIGDRVVLSFTSCGRCESCRSGHPAYCNRWLPDNLLSGRRADGTSTISQNGSPLGGHFFGQSSFATYAVADERSCVRVETDLEPALLAPLGCGVQTGTGAVWNVLRPQLGQSIAVFGVGTVGLAAIMAARLSPVAEIIAVDMVSSRLDLALQLGATRAIDVSKTDDVVGAIQEASGGGLHGALEATGNTTVLESAIGSIRERGQVAIVGAPAFGASVQVDVNSMMPGRRITGVTLGGAETQTSIPALVRLVEQGRLDVDSLVQHYPLEEITSAIEDMKAGTTIKPVLLP